VELEEIGPGFDMKIRRTKFASPDLLKNALQKPRALKPAKQKNVHKTTVAKIGRVFVPDQDLSKVVLHKMKGAKRKRVEDKESNKKRKAETQESAGAEDE